MLDEDPPRQVIAAINPSMILQSFSNSGEVTIFLNEMFNKLGFIYSIEKMTFFRYLKELVCKKRISREKTCFFKHFKEDKDITLIHQFFPFLKRYEVAIFLKDYEKQDPDGYDTFLVTIGLRQEKMKKLTVAEKKVVAKKIETLMAEERQKSVSLSDWESNFS